MSLIPWFDSQKNKRQSWHAIERAWVAAHPEWDNRADVNAAILKHVLELESQGLLQTPKQRSLWSLGSPPHPEWCAYTPPKPLHTQASYKGPWHARLGFNTQYKDDTLRLLVQINAFLLNQDQFDYLVPLKERSLQICGDEKRLDAFRTSNTHLFKDLLALEHIGAFHAEAPLAYEAYPNSSTDIGLILENQDSYYSFRVWNKKALHYRAVVYGCGNALSSSYRNLPTLQKEHGVANFEYLGDVDYTGFQIPERVAALLPTGMVHPATHWYQWLLRYGIQRRVKQEDGELREPSAWLASPELRYGIQKLWAAGYWIPQESLGLDNLMAIGTRIDSNQTDNPGATVNGTGVPF